MKNVFFGVFAALLPITAFGLGASIEVQNIQMMPKGANYLGIDQKTREARKVKSDTVFLEYKINGESRRLWDDDGLAVLFLYHRDISAKVYNGDLKEDSKLPMPKQPLIDSLERLHAEYLALVKYYEDKSGDGSDFSAETTRAMELANRARKVKEYVASNRFKEVSDLRTSGFEALVNDAESNHTYMAEIGGDKNKRNRLSFFLAKGIPNEIGERMAAKCKDSIAMDWKKATKNFSAKGKKAGSAEEDASSDSKDAQ
jgi:hypothetical protein